MGGTVAASVLVRRRRPVAASQESKTMLGECMIASPREALQYPGREADCVAALRPWVAILCIAREGVLAALVEDRCLNGCEELFTHSERAGWGREETGRAARHIAREFACVDAV